MLSKILKGSRDKKQLEHRLEQCPVYGFYRYLTLKEIVYRIDFIIQNGYLEVEYSSRLPVVDRENMELRQFRFHSPFESLAVH
ncbi:MAG: RQC domain-containing protein [Bacteroidota bacterium]|nr:RQC domain-containing protein [Bacteroidota bacterium]